jgi:acetate kinase
MDWLKDRKLDGITHRVVQGGEKFVEPQRIDSTVLSALKKLVPLAPEHLPGEIESIESFARDFPDVPQIACFDTAFHRSMPPVAQTVALPPEHGLVRFGFHGLSYEYIREELNRAGQSRKKAVIAHLGNGCSMAAVRGGVGIDTTMGFTPTGGLVMGTRSGDLDPGVIVYLLREHGLNPDQLNDLVNKKAGLLGVSGLSPDMRELLTHEGGNPRAKLAIDLFCYQAKKFLGCMAAALGGIDTLVFTGGIGENSSEIRKRICTELEYLGIRLDPARNNAGDDRISQDNSPVSVLVIKTNEELMLVRHASRLLSRAS